MRKTNIKITQLAIAIIMIGIALPAFAEQRGSVLISSLSVNNEGYLEQKETASIVSEENKTAVLPDVKTPEANETEPNKSSKVQKESFGFLSWLFKIFN